MEINLPDRLYYEIKEVAEAFGVNESKLRFWEEEFPMILPKRKSNQRRKYTKQDIETIKLIYFLVEEEKYTLEGAKIKLNDKNYQKTLENFKKIEKLQNVLNTLKGIYKNL